MPEKDDPRVADGTNLTTEREYKLLPEGNSAVVWNSTADHKFFIIRIGEAVVHKKTEALERDLKERATDWACVPSHPHATPTHWIGFKPFGERSWSVMVEYGLQEQGKVRLSLVRGVFDWHDSFGQTIVDEALFKDNGFKLEIEREHDEEGTILNPTLSQALYDFQQGQGQFSPNPQESPKA